MNAHFALSAFAFLVSRSLSSPVRNTFISLKRITGSFSCFRCLIFKVLCALFFSVKRLTILSHLSMFVKNFFQKFFGSFFRKELFNSITSFDVCQELFRSHFRGTFLSYHNHSRFVKIFFRSVERLTILPRFLSLVNAFFRFFSPFCSVLRFYHFFSCLILFSDLMSFFFFSE